MQLNKHTFSITDHINPTTDKPFGDKYSGSFTVRRPTIGDNGNIALSYAAMTAAEGNELNPVILNSQAVNLLYPFAFMKVVGEQKPEWFDKDSLYEEDEPAITEVYTEVERWLGGFRFKKNPAKSATGSAEPALLVQAEV